MTSSSSGIRTQIATASKHGGLRYLPRAFTEHGAIMAASVLNSPRAVAMSVFVVRAFVNMRRMIGDQRGLARKLSELERTLTARLNVHETAITEVLQRILRLLNPPDKPKPPRKQIGFHVQEWGAMYSVKPGRRGTRKPFPGR